MKEKNLTKRQEKRVFQSQIKKALRFKKIVPANDAFIRIKSELTNLGWFYEEEHNNVVEYYGKWNITVSPALKLITEVFHITLIPRKDGIEISRLEVYEKFRGIGYAGDFLNCILTFLLKYGIHDIFLIPLPAGMPENIGLTALDTTKLKLFYSKRGFKKIQNDRYWNLDVSFFSNFVQGKKFDFELLREDYVPRSSSVFIGKTFSRKIKSMPIKMKIYNRA